MNDFIRYIKKRGIRAVLTPMKVTKVRKNRILLINDLAYNYSGNPKYISEYILNHYSTKIEIVFALRNKKNFEELVHKGIKPVEFNTIEYFYYALTSKVIITNSGGISYIPLRKNQYVINTHHGGGAYKTAGIDMFEDSKYFRKDMLLSAQQTDCFLSTNRRFTAVMSKACLIPKNVFWEIGMPRNDRLLSSNKNTSRKMKDKIGISNEKKLVLYAPTYRKVFDNYYKSSVAIQYDIDSQMVCEALKKRFGGEWVFAYRLHPCIENKKSFEIGDAVDFSEYEDMQDLLDAADILINDFSSSFWDFMLTGKPCFMYAPDLDHYIETTKVYTPVDEWPFPKSRSNDELKESILQFDMTRYKNDCKRHYEALGGCETGHATQMVCEKIVGMCC